MNTRTRHDTMVFERPFALRGHAGMQPPGTYAVETEEALMDSISFVVWRRVSTRITLRPSGTSAVIQVLTVEPQALAAAQASDATACGR